MLHRILRGAAAALFLASLLVTSMPPSGVRAAVATTHYRPAHPVHLASGTFTGYRFSSNGAITARKTATLAHSATTSTSLRTSISGRGGAWLYITNGTWAGYYLRESHRAYLPYIHTRPITFLAGKHTGYRFDGGGHIAQRKTVTLSQRTYASARARALIGDTTYFLMANGTWGGYWVRSTSSVHLRYPALGTNQLALEPVVSGLNQPLFVTNAGDGTNRLFVLEREGRIRVISGGTLQGTPFMDITTEVGCCDGERGLLGLAFHPNFATNHRFYVYYTDTSGDIVVARYLSNAGRTAGDATSGQVLFTIPHPNYSNHNGGWMGFGKDGNLYIATGDGGGGGDPNQNSQNTHRRLGKILRIRVNQTSGYSIPATNPFANGGGSKPVWAWGLRNPWRDSFDRSTGDLYIGDVGQNSYEEIDRAADGAGGQNYGWNVMEGFSCYNASSCATSGKTKPVTVYAHATGGCAVTGGYIYRGTLQPRLRGHYLLADYCSGKIWSLYQSENVADPVLQAQVGMNISSFGEGEHGEIYVTDLAGGGLYHVVLN